MTPQNQLIFDKSNSIRSRTKKCKNLSHKLKLKSLEVLFIKGCRNIGLQEFKYFWKINPNGFTVTNWIDQLTELTQNLY